MGFTLGVTFSFLKSGVLTSLLSDFSFILIVRPLLDRAPPQLLFLINLDPCTQFHLLAATFGGSFRISRRCPKFGPPSIITASWCDVMRLTRQGSL